LILNKKNINKLISLSSEAGNLIREIYITDFDVKIKEDQSPLTLADSASNKIITDFLKVFTPNIPILSEEGEKITLEERLSWNQYWLIDPLDGTKEFIKRNNEFTVNIALINNNLPILGIIHSPISREVFWGSQGFGSFYIDKNGNERKIKVKKHANQKIKVASSRSHSAAEHELIQKYNPKYELVVKGSSLKFCLVALGEADIYIRNGPTSEWDTAAGHAIVKFAGGNVLTLQKKELKYNLKESLLNPPFVAGNIELIESFIDN
tara:strand:+ start:1026 stop:1820 length:795 start_codon:yes stop_codon:yes gene_type:complete